MAKSLMAVSSAVKKWLHAGAVWGDIISIALMTLPDAVQPG